MPEGHWTTYTNGNYIDDIVVYGDYVWCATSGGIVQWNKHDKTYEKFVTVENRPAIFTGVTVDRTGTLWFGSSSAIVSYKDGLWSDRYKSNIFGYSTEISLVPDMDNIIWVGDADTRYGILSIDGSTVERYSEQDGLVCNNVRSVAVDSTNIKWFGTIDGVTCFDGSTWKTFTDENGLPENYVYSIVVDSNNVKWFKSLSYLTKYDGDTWEIIESPPGRGGFFIDSNDILWFSNHEGLSTFDGEKWITRSEEEACNNHVLTFDDNNILWMASESDYGLKRFDGVSWETWITDDPLPTRNLISCIAVDNDNVKWFGHGSNPDGGVSWFDGTSWGNYSEEDGLLNNRVNSIAVGPDNVKWFGHETIYGGITRFDGETWTHYTEKEGIPLNSDGEIKLVGVLAVDFDNVLWVGYSSGIASFDGTEWQEYKPRGFPIPRIRDIAVDHNNVKWFATIDDGVFSFNGTDWKNYTVECGLLHNRVYSVTVDDNNIKWFGTKKGLNRFDDKTMVSFSTSFLTSIDLAVELLACSNDGTLWCGSSEYLYRFNGTEFDKVFTREDWLIGEEIATFAVDHENTIWLGTYECLAKYEEDSLSYIDRKKSDRQSIMIHGSYPNPFNSTTAIEFSLPETCMTNIVIYSITGQKIRTLVSDPMNAGTHSVLWNGRDNSGRDVSSGMYLTHLTAGQHTANHSLMLIK